MHTPQRVDCDHRVVVVAEWCHRITTLCWADGRVLQVMRRVGGLELDHPLGVRVIRNGAAVAVCDAGNRRVCVLALGSDCSLEYLESHKVSVCGSGGR